GQGVGGALPGQSDDVSVNAVANQRRPRKGAFMTKRLNPTRKCFLASLVALIAVGCSGPSGRQGLRAPASQPALAAPGQFHGYIMSAQANTILVIDTATNAIVKRVKPPDLVQPANGKFHPNRKPFYASGQGKVTVWDTTDLSNPTHLKTITPLPGSTGEYRGVHVYRGSTTATDGDVYWGNIQDGKVYVYRAADLEGATPTPVKV